MNPEVKKLWVDALRSGKYKQGAGCLRQRREGGDQFCCLGVLTDLYQKETGSGKWGSCDRDDSLHRVAFIEAGRKEKRLLPVSVRCWAGLDHPNPKGISVLNDGGSDFGYIAVFIEDEL